MTKRILETPNYELIQIKRNLYKSYNLNKIKNCENLCYFSPRDKKYKIAIQGYKFLGLTIDKLIFKITISPYSFFLPVG